MERMSGILLPVFSLPSPYGIGSFGEEAFKWVDFLEKSGQRAWQVLPLGPTGFGDSPYQSFSSFALNPYFADPDILVKKGLLDKKDLENIIWEREKGKVSYDLMYEKRFPVLRKAFSNFKEQDKLESFKENNKNIENYALFMALKNYNNGKPWYMWESGIKKRHPASLKKWRKILKNDIDFYAFIQMELLEEWGNLKKYAFQKGIKIIGDIPIYASLDSCDVWMNPKEFMLDENYLPTEVAGVPPDAFTEDGQKWGNPLYRWDVMKKNGYSWWKERFSFAYSLFDVIKIDHFRGLESYYSIPAEDKNARNGKWKKGPGKDFISFIKENFKSGEIIAEDLGFLTDEVYELLNFSTFPGMKVLQFGFSGDEQNEYLPHRYKKNCVVYTGTHDNDTTMSWLASAPSNEVQFAKKYFHAEEKDDDALLDIFISSALKSQGNLCIIPMQDYLHLKEGRINTPSTDEGNWAWRMDKACLSEKNALRIRNLSKKYFRI